MSAFLVDTNCWMQVVRDRTHGDEVRRLLAQVPPSHIFVSIFSVHSIGNILAARGWIGGYADFLARAEIGTHVRIIAIPIPELRQVEATCLTYQLDFDDAYQYVAASLHGLRIVSFDSHFDRTPNGRLTPAAALQLFRDEQAGQQGQQNP